MGAQKPINIGPRGGVAVPQMPVKKMKDGGDKKPRYKGCCAATNIIDELNYYPHFKEMMTEKLSSENKPEESLTSFTLPGA